MAMLRRNVIKKKLQEEEFVLGTFVEIPTPEIVDILGLAGFDFVVIDREHGSIDLHQTENLIRACLSTQISPLVRVAACDPVLIRQPLDMGASGIHVPQVGSVETAAAAVRYSRFHPHGDRGLQPYVRAASYRAHPTPEFLEQANHETTLVLHIEGKDGVDSLEGILALEGVDVAFIGPYDLSQSLGIPGEVKHPKVRDKMLEALGKAKALGKCVGIYCDDVTAAQEWRELGVRYLAVSVDAALLLRGAEAIVRNLRGR